MKILVTGAAGRVGSGVGKFLAERGHEVRGTDLVYQKGLPFRLEVADLKVRENAYRLVEGQDAVVHLGNIPNHYGRIPQEVYATNTEINGNVFQAAEDLGVGKVVFASTVQVIAGLRDYGTGKSPRPEFPYLPLDEGTPVNPANSYALSKVAAEDAMRYHAKWTGGSWVAVRLPWVLRDEWIEWVKRNRERRGEPHEAFAYILAADAERIFAAAVERDVPGFRVYFPAAIETLAGRPVAELVAEHFAGIPLRRDPAALTSLVDTSALERDLGWKPEERWLFTER